ncbi:MAG: helicase-related protein, partial [Pseudomonadota bacterium]
RFDPYYWELDTEERKVIRDRSNFGNERHYIVAVRALDEGVNLPEISAYIDLNSTLSVRQMIHRIGRVLRLSLGKTSADILFLSDFKDERRGRELLALIDAMFRLSNSHIKRAQSTADIQIPTGLAITREELLEARDLLASAIEKFWAHRADKVSYAEASRIAQQMKIASGPEYRRLAREGKLPAGMPHAPDSFYEGQGWRGWKAFLGTDWYTLEEAMEVVQKKGIKTYDEYKAWVNSSDRPLRLPKAPDRVYKDLGWISWGDFLGTEIKSFTEARAVVRTLGFKTSEQYRDWVRSDSSPSGFPLYPEATYKDKGWLGFADFLGISARYRSLEKAIEYMATQGIKTKREFQAWAKAGNKPDDIPANPDQVYKDWQGWNHFLSVGEKWMSYYEAQALMIFHGINSWEEYQNWPAHIERPANLPKTPQTVYRGKGWEGFRTFFVKRRGQVLPFETSAALMKLYQFYSGVEFNQWLLSEKRPRSFPLDPDINYKDKGWISWPHFVNLPAENLNPPPPNGQTAMSFGDSSMYLRLIELSSTQDFLQALDNSSLPERFTGFPQLEFRRDWQGWHQFLHIAEQE